VLLLLIERAQLKHRARSAARAEVRQCPLEQRRWRLCRDDQAAATLLDLAQQAEDAAFPCELPDHPVDIIQTQALHLRQTLEHPDPERGNLGEWHVTGARVLARGRTRSLQQVSLARACRSAHPGEAGGGATRGPLHVLEHLGVVGGQKALEDRTVRETHPQRNLLHASYLQAMCGGWVQARRVNICR